MLMAEYLENTDPVAKISRWPTRLRTTWQALDTAHVAAVANRLNGVLAKLDADAGVTSTDYLATFASTPANVVANFNLALVHLDVDAGVTDTNHAALLTADLDSLGDQFVALCAKLDAGGGVTDVNYVTLWANVDLGTGFTKASGLGLPVNH